MTVAASRTSLFVIIVTYLAFISLGLPDGLLGIAWPFMSERADVPLESLGILLICFTIGYLATSSTSGKIMKVLSLGTLLAGSCLVTALSLWTYAITDHWLLIILASFFLGSGGGAIDSSINTFAASNFSTSTVNWLHAFYGIGATSGPLIVTFMLANNLNWFHGYLVVGGIQVSLALLFFLTKNRWRISSEKQEHHSGAEYFQTIRMRVVWLSMIVFFLYTGLEQGFGQWLFTILTKSRLVAQEEAGLWAGAYWGSLTVGRILFGIILTTIPVRRVLAGAFPAILAGACLFAMNISWELNLAGVLLLGLANAPIFPSLISLTPENTGKEHTSTAIGLQISMAMLGGALLPGIAGFVSDRFGLEIIPIVFAVAATLLAIFYTAGTRRRSSSGIE